MSEGAKFIRKTYRKINIVDFTYDTRWFKLEVIVLSGGALR